MNSAKRFKVSAEIVLTLNVFILITTAAYGISLGNTLRVQILLSSLFFVMFMWLGWLHPKPTGIALIVLGTIFFLFTAFTGAYIFWILFGVLTIIAGFLFLITSGRIPPAI